MTTFKAEIYAHQKRADGTYNIKIRVTHNRKKNSNVQQGSNINCPDLINLFAEATKGYQGIIKKKDEQIDKLIEIMGQMVNK
jgi:hypothetical protein